MSSLRRLLQNPATPGSCFNSGGYFNLIFMALPVDNEKLLIIVYNILF